MRIRTSDSMMLLDLRRVRSARAQPSLRHGAGRQQCLPGDCGPRPEVMLLESAGSIRNVQSPNSTRGTSRPRYYPLDHGASSSGGTTRLGEALRRVDRIDIEVRDWVPGSEAATGRVRIITKSPVQCSDCPRAPAGPGYGARRNRPHAFARKKVRTAMWSFDPRFTFTSIRRFARIRDSPSCSMHGTGCRRTRRERRRRSRRAS